MQVPESEVKKNVSLNIKEPVFNQYDRKWHVKHTDLDTGRPADKRFSSLSEAQMFYEELYQVFYHNYLSIILGNSR